MIEFKEKDRSIWRN